MQPFHVTKSEYDRTLELVNDVLPAKGKDVAALWLDQSPVARALIDLVEQEVKAYHEQPRRQSPPLVHDVNPQFPADRRPHDHGIAQLRNPARRDGASPLSR